MISEVLTQDQHLLKHKHSKLKDLQGGSSVLNQFYHLTLCQYNGLLLREFTGLHKHSKTFDMDSNCDIQPKIQEAFELNTGGDLIPVVGDFDDAYYEEDVNGDIEPKDDLCEMVCA